MSVTVPKLRVAVMIDSHRVTRWEAVTLRRIQDSAASEIILCILNGAPPPVGRPVIERLVTQWQRLPERSARHCLEWFHERFVEGPMAMDDPFAIEDIQEFLTGIPQLTVQPIQKRVSDYFSDEDLTRIASFAPDVLIRFGFRILRGKILQTSRYGVWSLHHGDNRVNRGGPAGFWESMEAWPTTGLTLQVLNEDLDNGLVLDRTNVATNPWSVQANRANLFWKGVDLIPRKLVELHRLGPEAFFQHAAKHVYHPHFYCRRLYTHPTTLHYARLVGGKFLRKLQNRIREKFTVDRWQVWLDLRDGMAESLWRFRPVESPPDRYWADPIVLQRGEQYYVFVEEFLLDRGRGRIAVLVVDARGTVSGPSTVLETDYHLSYPFVFEHDGELFMVPESGACKTVQLYRCTRFPDQWNHVMNLIEGEHYVDATLHFDGTRWWMFAGKVDGTRGSQHDQTYLFYADDFRTRDWTPHPLNPINHDVASSRPAGPLFSRNGRLYRPTQNCSYYYGFGLQLCHVQTLTTTDYEESVVTSLTPDWRPKIVGTHALSHAGRLTAIDACVRQWKWW